MPITQDMLQSLIQKLQSGRQPALHAGATNSTGITGTPINAPLDELTISLIGKHQPHPETPAELAKLTSALVLLSSDVEYGTGRFYDSNGNPELHYWLAGIWAIVSLNWPSGKDIARNWSKQSTRYTEDGFEKAWNSYSPAHANGIGIGSLYKRAKELGWNQTITVNNISPSPQRFTLLGINDLAALPPTEHLVKGVLPSSGLAAIYGPSGSGKTFLALDLIMAIAFQSDWFGHKVKNVPVTYVGLEGKGALIIASKHGALKTLRLLQLTSKSFWITLT